MLCSLHHHVISIRAYIYYIILFLYIIYIIFVYSRPSRITFLLFALNASSVQPSPKKTYIVFSATRFHVIAQKCLMNACSPLASRAICRPFYYLRHLKIAKPLLRQQKLQRKQCEGERRLFLFCAFYDGKSWTKRDQRGYKTELLRCVAKTDCVGFSFIDGRHAILLKLQN